MIKVIAYNGSTASLPASLEIYIQPLSIVRLDALAEEPQPISGKGEGFLPQVESGLTNCHTGLDCYRFTYKVGGGSGAVYWWPRCLGTIIDVRCRETGGGQDCVASIKKQTWDEIWKGACSIDVLKAGNLNSVKRLTFWARGSYGGEIVTFKIGSPDVSPEPRSSGRRTLKSTWEYYTIDLTDVDLTNAVVLFSWYANDNDNHQDAVFYLDDIQFEGEGETVPSGSTDSQYLIEAFARSCWIAYSPTDFNPTTTPPQWPTETSVREDLRVLRNAGFNGLVTYSSNYANRDAPDELLDIPALAQEAGFKNMIVGIWDPADEQELRAAEQAAQHSIVLGYCVGNEGLDERYDLGTLVSAMGRLRRTTGKPVSTTEQIHDYYENSPLWTISDWIFPNTHPYYSGYRDPHEAVEWTRQVFETLDSLSDKPLFFKEVGLPSGGDSDLSQMHQAQYYRLLRETRVVYVVFEAFDAPWKHLGQPNPDGTYSLPDPEPHWGIFTSDRIPKEAVVGICPNP